MTVLLDDHEALAVLDDELDRDVLVAFDDEEPRAFGPDVLVVLERERDAVEATGTGAFADEVVLVEAAELERLLLDRLVDRPEEHLVAGEPLVASLVGRLDLVGHAGQSSREFPDRKGVEARKGTGSVPAVARTIALRSGIAAATALLAFAATANTAPAATRTVKACVFVTAGDDESGPTENIKIQDSQARRTKGSFTIAHAGKVIGTSHFVLSPQGIALASFPVTGPGVFTLAVKLATRPPQARTLRFTINAGNGAMQQSGCTPH